MPAHGFFIRHVKNISMRDVEIKYMKEDLRPAVLLDDVQGADFAHFKTALTADAPTFVLKNVEDFNLYQSKPLADTHLDKVETKTL